MTTKSCKVLNLSRNNFGDKGIEIISEALHFRRSLVESLDFTSVGMKRTGFLALMLSLKQNAYLKSLKVDSNRLGSSQPFTIIANVFSSGCILKEFSASNCELTDNFGVIFCDTMRTNKNMRKFNLSRNLLSDRTGITFADSLCDKQCKIEVANLSHN